MAGLAWNFRGFGSPAVKAHVATRESVSLLGLACYQQLVRRHAYLTRLFLFDF